MKDSELKISDWKALVDNCSSFNDMKLISYRMMMEMTNLRSTLKIEKTLFREKREELEELEDKIQAAKIEIELIEMKTKEEQKRCQS